MQTQTASWLFVASTFICVQTAMLHPSSPVRVSDYTRTSNCTKTRSVGAAAAAAGFSKRTDIRKCSTNDGRTVMAKPTATFRKLRHTQDCDVCRLIWRRTQRYILDIFIYAKQTQVSRDLPFYVCFNSSSTFVTLTKTDRKINRQTTTNTNDKASPAYVRACECLCQVHCRRFSSTTF